MAATAAAAAASATGCTLPYLRDMGEAHASKAAAFAEIVDNSVAAKATRVTIDVRPAGPGQTGYVSIEDNGIGADLETVKGMLEMARTGASSLENENAAHRARRALTSPRPTSPPPTAQAATASGTRRPRASSGAPCRWPTRRSS